MRSSESRGDLPGVVSPGLQGVLSPDRAKRPDHGKAHDFIFQFIFVWSRLVCFSTKCCRRAKHK